MYGGYGNLWNQASAQQWPQAQGNLPVQSQNQLPVTGNAAAAAVTTAQSYQVQQNNGNNGMQYGNPSAGMANYATNLGMQAGNPYMNYAANSAAMGMGYNQQNAAAMANAWTTANNTNLQFQQQVYMASKNLLSFPGGRPPLPPGPPPPDKPKEQAKPVTQAVAPPPPPPPPPASQTQPAALNENLGFPSMLQNILKPEDAYNIMQSAAALGLITGGGAGLAPLASLNVSEELFGSKNNGKGIPGLDGAEDVPPVIKTPEPELVDLEQDPANVKKEAPKTKENVEVIKPAPEAKTDVPWTAASVRNDADKPPVTKKPEKEIVWELRPEVKNQDWAAKKENDKFSQGKPDIPRNQQHLQPESKPIPKENFGKDSSNLNKSNSEETRVRIPLESTDGKQVIYDRKTLKQFDQKFRDWEGQFEKWKRDNENHPNQANYKQYLDQWNLWREQLVEQRRSILDTMTKAKMESKEITLPKYDSNVGVGEDKFSETDSIGASSSTSSMNKSSKLKPDETPWNQNNGSDNPFQMAMTNFGSTPSTSNNASMRSGPGNGNFNEKSASDERQSSSNVERILRAGGGDNNARNIFEDSFQGEQSPGANPFMEKSSNAFDMGGGFAPSNSSASKNNKPEREEVKLPFEWSLPSPSQKAQNMNPFDMPQSVNPFTQPAGPNPFDMAPQQKLPSLMDFMNPSFSVPTTKSAQQQPKSSLNPFSFDNSSNGSTSDSMSKPSSLWQEPQKVERIPRDPQGSQPKKANVIITPPSNTHTLRLEANPVGMPLLRAAAPQVQEEEQYGNEEAEEEEDEFSHLYSRDRGPTAEDDGSNMFDDGDFVEDAEVIDYGAANELDDLDLPRGEKANAEGGNEEEEDFSLEDTEVIDYSEMQYPEHPPHDEFYEEGYPPGYDHHGYPPFHPGMMRGRGRGRFPFPHPRGRGFRGPVPPFADPYYGMPYPPGPGRGYGPMPRGGRGGRFPPPHPDWYHHEHRLAPPIPIEADPIHDSPEVVVLSPSPEPLVPRVRIAPPDMHDDVERGRRRSLSGDRDRRRRSRSRSRDRVSRRREDSSSDRRGRRQDSPPSSRRDRERDRSPDSRRRHTDDRRDRYRPYGGGGRRRSTSNSRSRSPPPRDTPVGSVVRNPLFPSASAGTMASSTQASSNPPPPPRNQTVLVDDILNKPSRSKRPQRLAIFMRGLPGSGKSHIVKLIKEREVEMGGKAPRILSLDNYFITEIEKKEKDPVTGAETKTTVLEYEYDEEREPLYRAQLVRQFKKTIDDGYFSFVVVDGVNEYVRQFEEMANFATQKRFQVYVAEIEESVDLCVKRNTHKRTKDQLLKIQRRWEKTPANFIKLDTKTLLQDEAVDDDVEMEDVSDVETDANNDKVVKTQTPPPTPAERGKIGPQVVGVEDIEDDDSGDHLLTSAITSKWDTLEQSQEKLNKLDGLAKKRKNNPDDDSEVEAATSIEMWLTSHLPEDYAQRKPAVPGQKRVRWADIEERREQEKMREMGFVVGHTDWKRMMDPTFGGSALTKTKFI